MKQSRPHPFRSSLALSAAALTQLLSAVACFLGAFVLPATFPQFGDDSRQVLIVLGIGMLLLGLGNVLFGRRFNRLLARAGRQSRVVIPREGVGYLSIMLVLAVGGLLGHRNMPLLVFGMMAGPFILNGAIVYQMLKGTTVKRKVARRVSAGDFVAVEFVVHNAKRWMASHMLEVRDRITGDGLPTDEKEVESVVTFVRIPPGESRAGRYQVRFPGRGRYSFGPLRICSRFPLGIGERGQVIDDKSELIVHPRTGRLLPAWRQHHRELSESTRQRQSRRGVFDDEFHRIREYRFGDNPRDIHWRSTARHGELMICEYHQLRQADSLLVLDLPETPRWSATEAELAISLAATLCVDQTKSASGQQHVLAVAAAEPMLVCSRSPGGFREEALDVLATCQPSPHADLKATLSQVIAESALNDERLIVITPRPDQAALALRNVEHSSGRGPVDLSHQAVILEAQAEQLKEVFHIDDPVNSDTLTAAAKDESSRATAAFTSRVSTGVA